jgi:GT2 family glycosyltransferase/glycosyltransferase involved in cell wall biosynthesis
MSNRGEPEVTCILGMHRSGTSLVSRLVNLLGLDLGPAEKLMPPQPDNPSGFWEYRPFVEINEQILVRLGGSWHQPPKLPLGWETSAGLADLRRQARALVAQDFGRGAWAWKDPRACLTLPFWRQLLPPLRYVICLRNPAEVAQSLRQRDRFTTAKSIELWHLYTCSSLQHSADGPVLFLCYDDLLEDPEAEVRRLAGFVGREVERAGVREFIQAELRHQRTSLLDTVDESELAFPAKALYVALRLFVNERRKACDRAASGPLEARELWPLFSRCTYQAHIEGGEQARKYAECQASAEEAQHLLQVVAEKVAQAEQLRQEKEELEAVATGLRSDLDQQAAASRALAADLVQLDTALAEKSDHAELLGKHTQSLEEAVAALRKDVESQSARHQALVAALADREAAVANLQKALAEQTALAEKLREEKQAAIDYLMLVRQVQDTVSRILPPDARVAVVSRGDSELVSLAGRSASHFPQGDGGGYAGHYPADSGQAITLLEAQRSAGAEFLLFPSTAFWWLDHYGDLARHLDTHYPRVWKNETCQIYQLARPEWSPLVPRAPRDPQRNGPAPLAPELAATTGLAATKAVSRLKTRMEPGAYHGLVSRIRATASSVLPEDATAIVISRGDEDLLKLEGRSAWHYPQLENGTYAGHYPANSEQAVSHLEFLRARGGRFLIIPGTASWWLDHYDGFRRHLADSADCIWKNEDCSIFRLSNAQAGPPAGAADQTTHPAQEASQVPAPDHVVRALAQAPLDRYDAWLEVNGWNARREADLRARLAKAPTRPLLSVVMPVYNPDPQFLEKAIQTVCSQVYDHWELCIADDSSTHPEIHCLLKEWERRDNRVKVLLRKENGNISRATNSAAELACGEFLVLMDHDDELEPDALGEVACYLAEHPDADVVYSDDDKIDGAGKRFAPQFKPDWSPELLLSYMYLSHLFVIRRLLYWRSGGMRLGFEGSQDYDLALRATELTCSIGHIPKVLYHWRASPGSTASSGAAKPASFAAGRRAVQDALDRRGLRAQALQPAWAVEAACAIFSHIFPSTGPTVAILIPTKDSLAILRRCIDSLTKTSYDNYRIIIIDNGSEDPETLAYLRTQPHRVLHIPNSAGAFNYAALHNTAAGQVDEELLVFLNNDTEVLSPDWLSQMVGYLSIHGVGAVGARLLYSDGRIQHAGVVHGYWGHEAGHAFKCASSRDVGYLGYAMVARNYSAVTAACMITRRDTFLSLGGLDAQAFAVAYNDVDYCFRLWQQGLRIVYCPSAELLHHEGSSRGFVDNPAEPANYRKKHGGLTDPYYNINLSYDDEMFRVASRTSAPSKLRAIPTLMCSNNLNSEGAPYSQYELTVWLKKNGAIEPLVYSPIDGPLRREYEKIGIKVEVGHSLLPSRTWPPWLASRAEYDQTIERFTTFIRSSNCEVVYGNTCHCFFAIDAARLAHLPSIWNVRESEPWQTYFDVFGPAVPERALKCFEYAYRVIFVANATRAGYVPLDKHHSFATIRNGLDRRRLDQALSRWPRDTARRQLGIADESVMILQVGTICERKSQIDLVQALARLGEGLTGQIHCFIVGDRPGRYSEQLHRTTQELPEWLQARVHIVPETTDTALYYSAADLFVCTSLIESFPRVILEAMACGLPIVTTRVFGIVEQVRPEQNGLFCEPRDVAGLAHQIRRLLEDPGLRQRMATNSAICLGTINDYDTMAADYAQVFREAWSSGGPRGCVGSPA